MFESEGWEAGENEDEYDTDKYLSKVTGGFFDFIASAMPDLTLDECFLVHADAQIHWFIVFVFLQHGAIEHVYDLLTESFESVADFSDPTKYATFAHMARRMRRASREPQHDVSGDRRNVWVELMEFAKDNDDWSDRARAGSRNSRQFVEAIHGLLRDVTLPEDERASFDASLVQRHLHMARRVPTAVANLIGQFASSAITTRAPIPMRLQVKHKLELLSRSVASLDAETTAAELRAILADVEEALPIRKKPRPAPAASVTAATVAAAAADRSNEDIAPKQQPRK